MVFIQQKSISNNMILNVIRTLITVLFPLITFKYASKILMAENIGKISFSSSFIEYFILIAGLGISSYAIREGSRIRNDRIKFEKFSSEVLTLNVLSTLISYIILAVFLNYILYLKEYYMLIVIYSISIVFTTFGVEWVNIIYEDYKYLAIRTIFVQCLSLLLMFIFVRDEKDVANYILANVISKCGVNIINFFYVRKYCHIKLKFDLRILKHFKAVLLIFAMNLSITLYVSSDTILLSFLVGDKSVGYYAVAVKVYTAIKVVIAAMISVMVPRLSYFVDRDQEKYKTLLQNLIGIVIIITIPVVIALNLLSEEIILAISGAEFLPGVMSLKILSFAIIFSELACVLNIGVLLVYRMEKNALIATLISGAVNVVLNFIIIPRFMQNGAALTTLIAEFLIFIIVLHYSIKLVRFNKKAEIIKNFIQSMIACLVMSISICILKYFIFDVWIVLISALIIGSLTYFFMLWIQRNIFVEYGISKIKLLFCSN